MTQRTQLAFTPLSTHGQFASTALSVAATLTVPADCSQLLVQAWLQNARLIVDGSTAPTSVKGFRLTAGDPVTLLPVKAGQVLKFIEETASAVVEYQFGV